jgi:hypothetical protein
MPGTKLSSIADVYREFTQNSSVIGLNRVSSSHYRSQRILWFCVVVIGFITTAYHAETMIVKYLNYPSKTVVSSVYMTSVEFPAVTVCNQVPNRRSFKSCDSWDGMASGVAG